MEYKYENQQIARGFECALVCYQVYRGYSEMLKLRRYILNWARRESGIRRPNLESLISGRFKKIGESFGADAYAGIRMVFLGNSDADEVFEKFKDVHKITI
jgi:hypothetical protein